jgi:type IV secretion system protein VirD4
MSTPTPNIRMATKKKISKTRIIFYIIVVIAILYFATSLGASLDQSRGKDGKVKFAYISTYLNTTLSNPEVVFSYLKNGDITPKLCGMTTLGIAIFILYKVTVTPKRLHQRGYEYGSSKWGDEKEYKKLADWFKSKVFLFIKVKKPTPPDLKAMRDKNGNPVFNEKGEIEYAEISKNIILSQEIFLGLNSRQHRKNHNVMLIGSSGAGKTRFYVKPNLMDLNTSVVVTDPKAEILQSTGTMLLQAGYELKVVNLMDITHSSHYNPFAYVFNEDGSFSEIKIIKALNVMIKNTGGKDNKEDFWLSSAGKLMKSIILLLFEESEYNATFVDGKIVPETRDFTNLNIPAIADKMRKIEFDPTGQNPNFKSPLTLDFEELDRRKPNSVASKLYDDFKKLPQETGGGIQSTATDRTQFFNIKEVVDFTCCDTIHLETIGDKKTAVFLIVSATDSTFDFLTAMIYTQIFDLLAVRASTVYKKNNNMLPVPVRFIMDEFANIGQIPDFHKVIAFVRGFNMSLNVIIQNLAQIKASYEKTWESLLGNCDNIIFLGGQEESSIKFVSERLGKETIDIEARNRTKGYKSSSTSESNTIVGRELMTTSELTTMSDDNCIVMIKGQNPFYCRKYMLETHPNYRFLADSNPDNFYDVEILKTKTYEEFQEENLKKQQEYFDKLEAEKALKTVTTVIFEEVKEDVKVKSNVITFDFDPESYEESDMISELNANSEKAEVIFGSEEILAEDTDEEETSINEEISQEKYYGKPSKFNQIDFGEPKETPKETSEEVIENENLHNRFSVNEQNDSENNDTTHFDFTANTENSETEYLDGEQLNEQFSMSASPFTEEIATAFVSDLENAFNNESVDDFAYENEEDLYSWG